MSWRYKQRINEHGQLQTYDCSKAPNVAVCNSCHMPYLNVLGSKVCRECDGSNDDLDRAQAELRTEQNL